MNQNDHWTIFWRGEQCFVMSQFESILQRCRKWNIIIHKTIRLKECYRIIIRTLIQNLISKLILSLSMVGNLFLWPDMGSCGFSAIHSFHYKNFFISVLRPDFCAFYMNTIGSELKLANAEDEDQFIAILVTITIHLES